VDRVLAHGPDEAAEAGRGLEERVGGVDGAAPEVQRVVEVLVDDAKELRSPDTVGQERGHDRAGAAAHEDVEARVAVQTIFEGSDGADLVHPADDAATGEGEGVTLLSPRAPEARRALEDVQKIAHSRDFLAAMVRSGRRRIYPTFVGHAPHLRETR
jgi:hypothetical protein